MHFGSFVAWPFASWPFAAWAFGAWRLVVWEPDPSRENYAHAVVACAYAREGSGTEL